MKKISLLILVFVMLFAGRLQAEETNNPVDAEQNFPRVLPKVQPPTPKDNLVSFDESSFRTRMNDLEQRVHDLEQDLRFQDEKIDSLERSIGDVKRRLR